MKDEFRAALAEAVTHPLTFGLGAAIARWLLGDRAGGYRALLVYMACSILVAWAAGFYLADEELSAGKRNFYLLLLSFVARDVLTAMIAIGAQFKTDPIAVLTRLKDAFTGGPKT